MDLVGPAAEIFGQTPDLDNGFAHDCNAPLRKTHRKTKKPLKRSASRTSAKLRRGTTLIRAPPRGGGLAECQHTPALSRALPSRPMPLGQSAAQLQDHVRPAPPCPFSPLGALFDGSSGVLFSSSSLRFSIVEVLCSLHGLPGAVNGEGHRKLLPSP